jgi:hypothetical protein
MQGQIISRGDRRWLVRVFLGRDSNRKAMESVNEV